MSRRRIVKHHTTVEYTGHSGIRCTYLGPTNTKGSRWRVHRADEKYNDDPDRLTVPYQSGLGTGENVVAAIETYLAQKAERAAKDGWEGWPGRWVLSTSGRDEYIATWVERY